VKIYLEGGTRMQRQRRILSVYNRLEKLAQEGDPKVVHAVEILNWVLNAERDIQEIFPTLKLYKKTQDKNLFDTNQGVKYVMYSPTLERFIWEPQIPKHTPKRWWIEVDSEKEAEIEHELIPASQLDRGYFNHLPSIEDSLILFFNNKPKIHWTQVDSFFHAMRSMFNSLAETQKFLENDFEIDFCNSREFSPVARKELSAEVGVPLNRLKKYLKEEEKLIFITEYKRKGEVYWLFYDSKEDLNEENYFGFR